MSIIKPGEKPITLNVTTRNDKVLIQFSQPIDNLRLSVQDAAQLARAIARAATNINSSGSPLIILDKKESLQ